MTISTGTLRVGILAILAGLIGAYVIQQVLTSKPVAVQKPAPRPQVIPIAASDLPEGRVVRMGDIVLVSMTGEQLASRKVPINTVMVDPSQIIGRRLREPISQGALFTTTEMFLEYGGPDLSRRLKPGYRAFSLAIGGYQASGFSTGMMVDVMFRTSPRGATATHLAIPEMTVTLLQAIEIINVELPPPASPVTTTGPGTLDLRRRSGGGGGPPPNIVTLAVTPEQAKVLQTAMGHGEISLSPWSAEDHVEAPVSPKDGLTLDEILGIPTIPPPQPPVPPFITETFRRGGASVSAFNRDSIHLFETPKKVKPADLPAPTDSALPVPGK